MGPTDNIVVVGLSGGSALYIQNAAAEMVIRQLCAQYRASSRTPSDLQARFLNNRLLNHSGFRRGLFIIYPIVFASD